MKVRLISAAILVTATTLTGCAPRVRATNTTPPPAEQLAEIWQMPDDLSTRDLFSGAGGPSITPAHDATYSWLATDATGYSPGYDVRGSDGRRWSVKLGPEAQTEVVASRVLWALGYHQPAIYYVRSWHLEGGPGGSQHGARFRLESEDAEVVSDWSWGDNPFLGTQAYNGLIVANVLINSWDWKTSNNKVYRISGSTPANRYVVRDLGASFGRTKPSRLLWVLPIGMRGFGQGSRNNIDDFEAQGFIKRFDENTVEFDFHTLYGSVVDLVRPADVKWTVQLLNRVTDAQWDDAFRAADYSPEVRARFVRKIKAKIAEGLAVS